MTRVSIITLGCKVNFSDSISISENLRKKGYDVIDSFDGAECYVINTCAVTSRAEYQSRQAIRRARKASPQAELIVTGCGAAASPGCFGNIDGVSTLIPPVEKDRVIDEITSRLKTRDELSNQPRDFGIKRTRAFLKIQEGCNSNCSFCIVPRTRGAEWSMETGDVLAECKGLIDSGYREIVLCGIHLGKYGNSFVKNKDNPTDSKKSNDKEGLASLIHAIRKNINPPHKIRVRLSSIEPKEVTEALLASMKEGGKIEIAPYLHVPLQSGDDEILAAMNRPYSRNAYKEVIHSISDCLQLPGIGADVLVGFPGEGEEQFENTASLLTELPISYLHVFPFSPRPKTRAFILPGKIDGTTKKKRAAFIREIGAKKKTDFILRNIGREIDVLPETETNNLLSGKAGNYLTVYFQGEKSDLNRFVTVKMTNICQDGVYGKKVD